MKTLLFANQKGGVGKTTLTREVGLCFALESGKNVLLIDCDPQGNLTKSLTTEYPATGGLYEALEGQEVTPFALRPRLALLAADRRLSGLESNLIGEIDAHTRLRKLLKNYSQYDFVLLDTPPNLSVLTLNAMVAAGYLIIPMVSTQFAMQGTNDLLNILKKVQEELNPALQLCAVVIGQNDERPNMNKVIQKEIREAFGSLCLKQVISRTVRMEEAIVQSKGLVELVGPMWQKAQEEVIGVSKTLLEKLL